jgi:hypothetical protein
MVRRSLAALRLKPANRRRSRKGINLFFTFHCLGQYFPKIPPKRATLSVLLFSASYCYIFLQSVKSVKLHISKL